MKYTITLREGDTREKQVLESRGDLPRHVVLKLLAYVLYRDRTAGLPLQIEQRVGQRHKPDLVAVDPQTERVTLWIDCGQIETERLGRIARKNAGATVVVVKATAWDAERYAAVARPDLPALGAPGNAAEVTILGFDEGFVEMLVAGLRGTNTLIVTARTGHTLALEWNGTTQSTTLTQVAC